MSMINESFANLRSKLEAKGIKELECFKLNNKNLIGVDPFNPELDDLTKSAIIEEAKNNYWYFAEHCIRIATIGSSEGMRLPINLTTFESMYALNKGCNVYTVMPRQLCAIMSHCSYILWNCFKDPKFKFLAIGSSRKVDDYLFEKISFCINKYLPSYMRLDHYNLAERRINNRFLFNMVGRTNNSKELDGGELHFLNKIKLVLVDNYETFSYNLTKKVNKLLKYMKELDISFQLIMTNTCIGKKGELARDIGDLYYSTLRHFNLNDLNSDMLNRGEFLYVYNDYSELVENPEEWFKYMCNVLIDNECVDREVLCIRY